MRKRTIKFGLDNIFWYIIYLLPIIVLVVQQIGVFKNFSLSDYIQIEAEFAYSDFIFGRSLSVVMDSFGFNGISFLSSLFVFLDTSGIISGHFLSSSIFMYLDYFILVNLLHLFVDFILFIPRLAHKWMNTFTQQED